MPPLHVLCFNMTRENMKVLTDPSLCHLYFVHSYTLRVVGNGIKAQSANPEVKVKEADPVINQIIDKLKHINQVRISHFVHIFAKCTLYHFLFYWSSLFLLILYFYPSFCQRYGKCLVRHSANSLCFFVSLWDIKYLLLAFGLFLKVHRNCCPVKKQLLTKLKAFTLYLWIILDRTILLYHLSYYR